MIIMINEVLEEQKERNRPMPEVFTRRDIRNSGGWDVDHAPATRGEPYITVSGRVMRVPFDDSELSKAIRAHEQMHCKISPQDLEPYINNVITEGAIRSAEEARVNFICSELGFNMKALVSGSEKHDGKNIATSGDWESAVFALASSMFTGSVNPFLSGVRSIAPEWADGLRDISKEIKSFTKKYVREVKASLAGVQSTSMAQVFSYQMGSTELVDKHGTAIRGMKYTVLLAHLIQGIAEMPAPTPKVVKTDDESANVVEGEEEETEGTTKAKGERDEDANDCKEAGDMGDTDELQEEATKVDREAIQRHSKNLIDGAGRGNGAKVRWQPVVLQHLPLTITVQGAIGRKRVSSNVGRNPRRIHRMLIDPERRIFDKYVKAQGGVVVIDLSGSMSLSRDEVKEMMLACAGVTVIGYSGYYGGTEEPNTYILADKGKICAELPRIHGGNACDLPVVEYAVQRKQNPKAPVVWITDGYTYGWSGSAGYLDELECAQFAKKHRFRMEYSPEDAIEYLNDLKRGAKHTPKLLERWTKNFGKMLA
jgi:hypothetical protein